MKHLFIALFVSLIALSGLAACSSAPSSPYQAGQTTRPS